MVSVRALRRACFPKPSPRGNGCEEGGEPGYELYTIGYPESHLVGVCTTPGNVKLC